MTGGFAHPVKAGTGDLSWDSAAEMMAVIACLYDGDKEGVEKIAKVCKPKADVVALYFRREQETPEAKLITSYVLLRQYTRYFICIAGTEDRPMWKKNISGAFYRERYFEKGDVAVHGYFALCADTLYAALAPLIATGPAVDVTVAGHSLGAATANLLALRLKEARPERKVYCIGYGEPRSLGAGEGMPQLDGKWRVTNEYDPVTHIPPSGRVLAGTSSVVPALKLYRAQDWRHYGEERWVRSTGVVQNVAPPEERTVVLAPSEVKTYGAHMPGQYIRSLAKVHKNYGVHQRSGAILAVAADRYTGTNQSAELGLPNPDAIIDFDALNSSFGAGQAGPFDATNWRSFTVSRVEPTSATVGPVGSLSSGFSGNSGVNPMSTGTTQSSVWRVVAHLNNANYGSSHSVAMKGPRNSLEAIALAKKWVTARAGLLGCNKVAGDDVDGAKDPTMSSPRYQYMVVQDAFNPRDSTPVELDGEVGSGWAAVTGGNTPADVFSAALSIRMQGVSEGAQPQRSYHVETFVGFPDKALEKGTVQWGVKLRPNLTFRNGLDEYIKLITDATVQFGFMGNSPLVPKKLVEQFTSDMDGTLRCLVTAHGYDTGDVLSLTGKVGKKLRGKHTVVKVDANTFRLLNTRVNEEDLPRSGRVQRVKKADGTRDSIFYRFLAPTAVATDGGYLVKISKRNLRPRSIPISFAQKGRK